MNNSVIVFDLDGTFLDSKNQIIGGELTLQCLQDLRKIGCSFAICTGRLDHDILKINEHYGLNIENRISQNGAVVIKSNEYHGIMLDREEARKIYLDIQNEKVRIEINTVSNRYWQTERDPNFPKELYDSHIIKEDYEELLSCQPVVLFLIVGETEELQKIANKINQKYKFSQAIMTSSSSLEIVHKMASKGKALQRHFSDQTIYAIGDSPSDFDMIAYSQVFYNVGLFDNPENAIKKENILEALQDIKKKVSNE